MVLSHSERKAKVLAKRGLQRRIAKKLGVDPGTVGRVAGGNSRSKRIEREIAKALRLPLRVVFPPRVAGEVAGVAVL